MTTAQRRVSQGLCPRCGQKLTKGWHRKSCAACLAQMASDWHDRPKPRHVPKPRPEYIQRFERELERVVETCHTHKAYEQATLLGLDIDRVYQLRRSARKRGYDVPCERGGRGGCLESKAWANIDVLTKRCSCGLLLPCESCIPTSAELATSRPGPREAGLYTMKHPRSA